MTYPKEIKACFRFTRISHRGISRGCYIGSLKGCRRGTRQSEQSSDNITYELKMKARFHFCAKSHRGVSRGIILALFSRAAVEHSNQNIVLIIYI